MTNVLAFGDDHSAEADVCWEWIASHMWDGWNLEIVTAHAPEDLHPVSAEEAELHAWEPSAPRPVESLGFGSVEYLRAEIDARVALISKPWDLVAVGPRGSGLLKRLHLGSTADWLLREPTSPLVIARDSGPVRRILFAADGSQHSRRAKEILLALPWVGEAEIDVLAVDDKRIDAEKVADEAAESFTEAGVEINKVVRAGKPTQVILDFYREQSHDLIALGARGLTPLKRVVIGSTTSGVAEATDCSLLVAHAWDPR